MGYAHANTTCNIIEEYGNIFTVEILAYNETAYVKRYHQKVDAKNCFAELINQNQVYLGYLQTNFSDRGNAKRLKEINDTVLLREEFIHDLQQDTLFNRIMLRFAEKFNQDAEFKPDTVSMDQLLNIGAKFFSLVSISDEGFYASKVCNGMNDLKKTEVERKPHIEAFCFAAVYGNYGARREEQRFNTYDELVSGIKELYKLNLGIDMDERLLRAQGALYMYMRNNSNLKELLQFEYNQKAEYLPFVLV